MPTNRRKIMRAAKTKREGISKDRFRMMLDEEPLDNPFEQFFDITRQEWSQNRDAALKSWIKNRPGTRPDTWWKFDAPEKYRRKLSEAGYTEAELRECSTNNPGGIYCWYNDSHNVERDQPVIFESQSAFLRRHMLLTAYEKRVLNENHYKPEKIVVEHNTGL
jgi:hypothetical protein